MTQQPLGPADEPVVRARRWLRWPAGPLFTGSGFESTRYLTRWVVLSTAIGCVAGVGAVVFTWAINVATQGFLGDLVGYLPPSPAGEGTVGLLPFGRPWALPLVVALGGLISGIIVFTLAPEAEGHGTDSAIAAIHHNRARIRARIPPIKLIASAITIGSGGSGGREGPTAQISAGFGSLLGQWLNLDIQDRRIAVAAGVGAGIGSIFRAPLGGAVLGAEILYIHDLEIEALIPALIASIVGYTIYGAVYGFTPIFGAQPELALGSPVQILYYAVLGVISGLGGLLYAKSFYGITALFHRLGLPRWVKPALGGLLVGLLGLVIPGALYMGYGWVQIVMGPGLLGLPLWMLLLLPFAKILATSLSIGSGGSGGIFGPGMVIGATLGASFWRLTYGVLPQMPDSPAPFVIIGMMSLFGGIAHAPLAVMLMVAEMTGNLSLLAPAMVAVGISTALVGDETIYHSQLPNRASSPAHRVQFSFPLLATLLTRDALTSPGRVLTPDTTVAETIALPKAEVSTGEAIVVDRQGSLRGVVTRDDLDRVPEAQRDTTPVSAVMRKNVRSLLADQPLDAALEQLADDRAAWAPVVDATGRLVGVVGVRDAIATYKATLQRSVRRTQELPGNTTFFEAQVAPGSPLDGQTLATARLPSGCLVVSISRYGETIFPRAATRLEAGDTLMVVADPASEHALRSYLEPAHQVPAGSDGSVGSA